MARQPELSEVLNGLSKEELVRIILQAAEHDDLFKNGLLVKYAQGNQNGQLKLFKKLMNSVVKKYVGREGFIPYRETSSFAMDMIDLLEQADEVKDNTLALEMAMLVLQEGVEAFQYADDSDGSIGMLVDESFERIRGLASSPECRDAFTRECFFERLLELSDSDVFEGWDEYRIVLLQICAELAEAETLRERLKAALERRIAICKNDSYGTYTVEELHKLLYQLIRDHGTEEEADRFAKDHLHYKFFRQSAIEVCLENGDYRRAIELAQEGELQDRQKPGLVTQWKRARYEAYKKLSLKNEQRTLGTELLLEGDYAYYQDLESLAEGGKEDMYREILAKLKKSGNWNARGVYLRLIADKNDLEEMMAYVRSNPSAVEEYAARLSKNYPEEVDQIYRRNIFAAAENSSKRKDYQQVCNMLKRYQKVFGKTSQHEMILQLKEQYIRKPAFWDELSKLH